jgi:hypothetical protein
LILVKGKLGNAFFFNLAVSISLLQSI